MNCVLDACAMIAYLRGEVGDDAVAAALADRASTCFAHAMNVCEVYYDYLRTSDQPQAEGAVATLAVAGVVIREDFDPAFWKAVGYLKSLGRIAIADCFAVVLAVRTSGEVLTSDHKEFDRIADEGICPVRFIR